MWKPPDDGFLKTNFDGAIFGDLNEAGIEVVVQNQGGGVGTFVKEESHAIFCGNFGNSCI